MTLTLKNTDFPHEWWEKNFNRGELRDIAKAYGIKRGRDKWSSAWNISQGERLNGSPVEFPIMVTVCPQTV